MGLYRRIVPMLVSLVGLILSLWWWGDDNSSDFYGVAASFFALALFFFSFRLWLWIIKQ